jgi:hypothetical protein
MAKGVLSRAYTYGQKYNFTNQPLPLLPKEKPPFWTKVTISKVISIQAHALKPVRAANLVPDSDPFVQLVNKSAFKSRTKGYEGLVGIWSH